MSYVLYSEDGYLTDIASVGGWWKLITEIDKVRDTGPLADFINTGKTTNPQAVIKEINDILPDITDSNVQDILKTLRDNLQKVKEIGIISG